LCDAGGREEGAGLPWERRPCVPWPAVGVPCARTALPCDAGSSFAGAEDLGAGATKTSGVAARVWWGFAER
jgi:hypothetical protein